MPRVFLCYRRDDAAGHAGRLYDRLADRFGDEQIFRDLDSIDLGQDFGKAIDQMVAACDVFLAVIGSRWLGAADAQGRRRLDDPNDWVHLEIASALKRDIPVIPVLVDRAAMPGTADLPEAIAPLARRNALTLTEEGWRTDVARLFQFLERAATATRPEQVRTQEDTRQHDASAQSKQAPPTLPDPNDLPTWRPTNVIFLSFTPEDWDKANPIVEALIHLGWLVGWDPHGHWIEALSESESESVNEIVKSRLDEAKCVVVLWSRAAATSDRIKSVVREATERGVLVIAIVKDIGIPPQSLALLPLMSSETFDLRDWNGDSNDYRFSAFAEAVAAVIARHEN
jgi:hypothetical protein